MLFTELMIYADVPLIAVGMCTRLVDPIYALPRKGIIRRGIVLGDYCRGRVHHARRDLVIVKWSTGIGPRNRICRDKWVVDKCAERLSRGVLNNLRFALSHI